MFEWKILYIEAFFSPYCVVILLLLLLNAPIFFVSEMNVEISREKLYQVQLKRRQVPFLHYTFHAFFSFISFCSVYVCCNFYVFWTAFRYSLSVSTENLLYKSRALQIFDTSGISHLSHFKHVRCNWTDPILREFIFYFKWMNFHWVQ